MKLALIVHSREQSMLDKFLASVKPTLDGDVIYAITEDLHAPNWTHNICRYEFNPNKYFNIVAGLTDATHLCILNDDILFSDGWLMDLKDKLKFRECVSPGFIETSDVRLAEMKTMLTLGYDGVHPGFFDACYAFDAKLVQGLGGF